jgi:hypothetical protein
MQAHPNDHALRSTGDPTAVSGASAEHRDHFFHATHHCWLRQYLWDEVGEQGMQGASRLIAWPVG